MGFFDTLKALGDPRYGIDSTIETQARVVESLSRKFPERDMNAWLAQTLRGRLGFGGREEIYYFNQTVVFSAALPETAMRGLGLMVALHEASEAGIAGQILAPYDAEFGKILRFVLGLIRFRGHVPKGGYDVPHVSKQQWPAPPPAVL